MNLCCSVVLRRWRTDIFTKTFAKGPYLAAGSFRVSCSSTGHLADMVNSRLFMAFPIVGIYQASTGSLNTLFWVNDGASTVRPVDQKHFYRINFKLLPNLMHICCCEISVQGKVYVNRHLIGHLNCGNDQIWKQHRRD